ncbi:MAG: shikimate kinase [Eubacteriales bacterium]|nr:shikimate kinase [Eubacteriales bacterium]
MSNNARSDQEKANQNDPVSQVSDNSQETKIPTPLRLEEIRAGISECDDVIIHALARRMRYVQDVISYKKATGMPIFQPAQERRQMKVLEDKIKTNGYEEFEEELLDVFKYIIRNSRRIQSRSIFDYNIFLIGFMGAGKTTIAKALSQKLEMNSVEMDQLIVEKQKMSVSEIFDEYGEQYYRNLESNCLIELRNRSQTVVSCGGGIVLRDENREIMRDNGRVVLLTARPDTILERVKDSDERPILNNNMNVEFISGLMEKRRARYQAAADITIETDDKTITQICDEIISSLIFFDLRQ